MEQKSALMNQRRTNVRRFVRNSGLRTSTFQGTECLQVEHEGADVALKFDRAHDHRFRFAETRPRGNKRRRVLQPRPFGLRSPIAHRWSEQTSLSQNRGHPLNPFFNLSASPTRRGNQARPCLAAPTDDKRKVPHCLDMDHVKSPPHRAPILCAFAERLARSVSPTSAQ